MKTYSESATDIVLESHELRDFLKDIGQHSFSALRWSEANGFSTITSTKHFGYQSCVTTGDKFKIDPTSVSHVCNFLRAKGKTWINQSVENWAIDNAVTPADIIRKILYVYQKQVNFEKSELYRLAEIQDPGGLIIKTKIAEMTAFVRNRFTSPTKVV